MSPSKYYREERGDNSWSTPTGVVTAGTPGLPGGIYIGKTVSATTAISIASAWINIASTGINIAPASIYDITATGF